MSEPNIKDFMQAARAVSWACLELVKCVDALAQRPVSRHLVLWVIHIYQRSAYAALGCGRDVTKTAKKIFRTASPSELSVKEMPVLLRALQ
jgi:hypothetical protein